MQIQKVVGVMGELHQRAAQALQFGGGGPVCQVLSNSGAHGAHISLSVWAQGGQHLRRNGRCKVGVMAVEVLGGVQLKAAHGLVVQALGQAYRVGHGHQHHFAAQQASGFGGF